ncbi:MAG: hypothetical protein NT159_11105 [Proteobacteria bacterium]|nr:hypothetical protein [Pseudomonadota bacterium]
MESFSKHKSATSVWTHREYFRRFSLNVEQYGEILIAQVFDGTKKGDAQPCYDVEASEHDICHRLLATGVSQETVERCLSGLKDGVVRIEVKSKLEQAPAGKASVIHCSDNKIDGVEKRNHRPATHFAVILFGVGERKGIAERAWLFSNEVARGLRQMETKSRYIPVSLLEREFRNGLKAIIDISSIINEAASSPLAWQLKKP